MAKPCPCTSGREYAACCAPLHKSERDPATPEDLMRSRFAAFAVGDAEYLWHTLHPEHEERALPKSDVVRALKAASRSLKYMRLTILDAKDAQVLFVAGVFEKGKDRSFVELSSFAREGTSWRYLAGENREASAIRDVTRLTIATFARAAAESA